MPSMGVCLHWAYAINGRMPSVGFYAFNGLYAFTGLNAIFGLMPS